MSNTKLTSVGTSVDIGIDAKNRQAVAEALVQLLADEHVLYIKTRNYHWNVTGIHFRALHALFEEQYTALAVSIDEVAERIRSLGYFAPGTLDEFLQAARLVETDHLNGDAKKMLENLLQDHETVIQILRHDLEEAIEAYHDAGTGDFLTGLMEAHEKMAWMLRAHLA